jgi:hypothetical protein
MFPAGKMGYTLLQYVDDLLAESTSEECAKGTHLLPKHLWESVYKVSKKKAQI